MILIFFFKQKTAYELRISDWSSDVCSSDLIIAFGVRLFEKLSKGEMDERVEWALYKAALWEEVKDKLHQSGNGLSGGQQQRLCIARGVAIKPEEIGRASWRGRVCQYV